MNPEVARLFTRIDAPPASFSADVLGPEFPAELATVSALWFRCGYRPGIASYLAFFLLRDFVVLHDTSAPARFRSPKAMARSFYATDLFIREVTDSGREPSGGISSAKVRDLLAAIMARHRAASIPAWMMTWFGWILLESVETQCAPLTAEEQRLHLAYMTKVYRIMGVPFVNDRATMTEFARAVERTQVGASPQRERHARAILGIAEMIGVSSAPDAILPMLPEALRATFAPLAPHVRPGLGRRFCLRMLGKLLLPRAVGTPRRAVPLAA